MIYQRYYVYICTPEKHPEMAHHCAQKSAISSAISSCWTQEDEHKHHDRLPEPRSNFERRHMEKQKL